MAAPLFPPPLKKGGTIGIVAPARWPKPEWLETATSFLKRRGYKVIVHPQNYLKDGQLAGDDAARAGGIMDMFADPAIDAILCARGGANAIRIVDKLDYKLIKRNPKPFIGFSDIALLLNAIYKQCGFITFHGPMVWNFAHPHDRRTADDLFDLLENKKKNFKRSFTGIDCIKPGKAEGVLVGGNITRLELLMSTPYDWTAKDSILFLEDVDEVIYKLDEKLHHLRLAGRFKNVCAVIVGEMIDIADGENGFAKKGDNAYGKTLRQVFLENLPKDIPLCMDFPCGHGKYITTLPIGAQTKLALNKNGVELTFMRP
jgi:muramoyltetrapeptide carboxypeptidase